MDDLAYIRNTFEGAEVVVARDHDVVSVVKLERKTIVNWIANLASALQTMDAIERAANDA